MHSSRESATTRRAQRCGSLAGYIDRLVIAVVCSVEVARQVYGLILDRVESCRSVYLLLVLCLDLERVDPHYVVACHAHISRVTWYVLLGAPYSYGAVSGPL